MNAITFFRKALTRNKFYKTKGSFSEAKIIPFFSFPILLAQIPPDYAQKQYEQWKKINNQVMQEILPQAAPYSPPITPLSTQTPNINSFSTNPTHLPQTPKLFSIHTFGTFNQILKDLPQILLVIAFISLSIVGLYYLFRWFIFRKILSEDFKNRVFLAIRPLSTTNQSAFSTEQLLSTMHSQGKQQPFWRKFFKLKKTTSLEIVSTKHEGIKFIIQTTKKDSSVLEKNLLAYLPGVQVTRVSDYLPQELNQVKAKFSKLMEFKLANHFSIPLKDQKTLTHSDPIAYITSHMTKLEDNEMISMQLVLTPLTNNTHQRVFKTINKLNQRIWSGFDISDILNPRSRIQILALGLFITITIFLFPLIYLLLFILGAFMYFSGRSDSILPWAWKKPRLITKSPQQEKLYSAISEKIDSQLFEGALRVFLATHSKRKTEERSDGFKSTLSSFTNQSNQAIVLKRSFNLRIIDFFGDLIGQDLSNNLNFFKFKHRLSSLGFTPLFTSKANTNMVLSSSEAVDLYHLPFTDTTKTEDLVTVRSKELPAPLALKQTNNLDIICGINRYGGTSVSIGLTREERYRHLYILGATGTGKSMLLLSLILQDIKNQRGLCLVDPHGDLAQSVLYLFPENRKQDLIYFDPFDIKHPICINLLEKTPGLDCDERELENESICENTVAIFRKVFSKELSTAESQAHRIERVFRNAIYTALTLDEPTLLDVFDLLVNPDFRNAIVKNLTDKRMANFWKYEFGKAGDWQKFKLIDGVTARIERFIFSPIIRRIIEQKKSTISFDDIMDSGKVLICNFSKGKLGDDNSVLLGTLVLGRIQLATMRRARIEEEKRRDFYIYVDEFQNYATRSFVEMMAESRKYGVYVTVVEQSTSQQRDKDLVHIIFANTGSIIMFKNADPKDEEIILPQFKPQVEIGEIANLPVRHFYMKISAINPREAFSGETTLINVIKDKEKLEMLKQLSRDKYGNPYKDPKIKVETQSLDIKENGQERESVIPKVGSIEGSPPEDNLVL